MFTWRVEVGEHFKTLIIRVFYEHLMFLLERSVGDTYYDAYLYG